jgi:quinol monooxygenase YgiN
VIKHIVMWHLKEHAQGNSRETNAQLVKQKLESLRGRIPGMLKIEVGVDFSATADSADIVLYSEFENREALDVYQRHPDHEAIKPFIMDVRAERRLVDYE